MKRCISAFGKSMSRMSKIRNIIKYGMIKYELFRTVDLKETSLILKQLLPAILIQIYFSSS